MIKNDDKQAMVQSKNATYERALAAFFEGQEPTQEQKEQLPDDVEGLSARRQALIEAIYQAETSSEQLTQLRQLRLRFGLPQDIKMIDLALSTEDDALSLEGLERLEQWLVTRVQAESTSLQDSLNSWRPRLNRRVDNLLFRSFNPKIQELAAKCQKLLLSI
mgnify:CR=1 FL=1